jgi:phage gpG-like protein
MGTEEVGNAAAGLSVALSADGNTALFSGPEDNSGAGAAWVFTRYGSTWTQYGGKLVGGEEVGKGYMGLSAALSGDGNTALLGGEEDNGRVGAAWVFTPSRTAWTQQGNKLTGGEESGLGFFGRSVALSFDGNTGLVGGLEDNAGAGAAWVFTRSGSTWTQQGGKLTGNVQEFASRFGASVALSSDGNTALIGGSESAGSLGAAWIFTRSGSTWTQQGKRLTGGEESGKGKFGESVALSADGDAALIGGSEDNAGLGAAWIFTRTCSEWTQQKLTGGEEQGAGRFGFSVALSSHGDTALIGGFQDNGRVGAAWVFANPKTPNTPTVVTCKASAVGRGSATFNATVNPEGREVKECKFEYGTETTYGSSVPCASLPGSGAKPVVVSTPLSCLKAGTTYHFRIAATNSAGTSEGLDSAFETRSGRSRAPEVETAVLPAAMRGQAYRAELSACGGRAPYKWKKVRKLPKGLKLVRAGIIEGVPTTKKVAAGSYQVIVKVTDSAKPSQSGEKALTLNIN